MLNIIPNTPATKNEAIKNLINKAKDSKIKPTYRSPIPNLPILYKHVKPEEILYQKGPAIFVTNLCPYQCGGCNQFCNLLPENKRWSIPIEQFVQNLNILKKYYKNIHIFGGEPTSHPQWLQLVEIMQKTTEVFFRVSTNTLSKESHQIIRKNIFYLSGKKHKAKMKGIFVPTLIAPIDLFKENTKQWFWERAKWSCYIWTNFTCNPTIYNNKAYFCQNAASFDILMGEDHGWPLKNEENPFIKTEEEINTQACEFCYRCGSCMRLPPLPVVQRISYEYSWISKTNLRTLPKDVTKVRPIRFGKRSFL